MNLKEHSKKPQRFVPGHRTCSGCGIPIIVRNVLAATDKPVVAYRGAGGRCAYDGCPGWFFKL